PELMLTDKGITSSNNASVCPKMQLESVSSSLLPATESSTNEALESVIFTYQELTSAPTLPTPAISAPTLPTPAISAPALPTPALPAPALPAPALPTPALSAPALPTPALPAPALPAPALPAPALSVLLSYPVCFCALITGCFSALFTLFGRNLRFFPVGTVMMELSDGFTRDMLDKEEVMKQSKHFLLLCVSLHPMEYHFRAMECDGMRFQRGDVMRVSGVPFPPTFKLAAVISALKKLGFDPEGFQNCRPISCLAFHCKLLFLDLTATFDTRPQHAHTHLDLTPPHVSQLQFLRGDVIELLDRSGAMCWSGRHCWRVGVFPPVFPACVSLAWSSNKL
ncbi:hypothetical protein P4O66_021251, partial [Electrophorus voltai]